MVTQTLCEAADCRRNQQSGKLEPRVAAPGQRLCTHCRSRLREDLTSLPGLYDSCEDALTPTIPALTERVTSGRSRQGIKLNEAALQARADMLPVLASWAGVIISERGVAGPRQREARPLTAFLRLHLDWLAAHPAAAECAGEIRRVANIARSAIRPMPVVQRDLGPCPMSDCTEHVRVSVRDDSRPDAHGALRGKHAVPPSQWLMLSATSA